MEPMGQNQRRRVFYPIRQVVAPGWSLQNDKSRKQDLQCGSDDNQLESIKTKIWKRKLTTDEYDKKVKVRERNSSVSKRVRV